MRNSLIASALVMTAVMTGCAPTQQNNISTSMLEGEWDVISYATDSAVVELNETSEVAPFMNFDVEEQAFYGNAGCNNFNGSIVTDTLENGSLTLSNVASTRMMCPSMETEDAILANLNQVVSFEALNENADTLQLLNAEEKVIITLAKRAAYSEIAGKWVIAEVNGEAIATEEGEDLPFMHFGINKAVKSFFGNAGCNNFNGDFSLEADNKIVFGAVAMTKMMCKDMKVEDAVVAAMAEITTYTIEGNTLCFLNKDQKVVIKLTK